MPDYSQGKIYRLVCDDPDLIYIGSTFEDLNRRLGMHKTSKGLAASSSKIMLDVGGLAIQLIEEYPCESKEQLLWRERHHVENTKCINRNRPIITEEERKQRKRDRTKKWAKDNPDLNAKITNEYYHKNKERINEQRRELYQANKEEINKKRREQYLAKKGVE